MKKPITHRAALLLLLALSPTIAAAQKRQKAQKAQKAQQLTLKRSEIPRLPLDTLPTDRGDVRLVTFSDGTFRFVPANGEEFHSCAPYTADWDTTRLFAYRPLEKGDLPESVTLTLTNPDGEGFCAPVTGTVISKYGPRGRRSHSGVDIRLGHGQPVFAAFDGVVRHSRWNSGGFGNLVIVRHPSGLETYYAHLSRRALVAGDWVRAGQVIGYGGRTGRATGNHLHFEVRYADHSFDPERIIDFERGELRGTSFALHRSYFNNRSRFLEDADDEGAHYAEEIESEHPEGMHGEGNTAPAPTAPTRAKNVYHTIRPGDTLFALSRLYSTTAADICRRNGISLNATLRIGKKLLIK